MATVTTTATVDPAGLDAALGNVGVIVRDYGDHRFIDAPVDEATILAAVASHTPVPPEPTLEERIDAAVAALAAVDAIDAPVVTADVLDILAATRAALKA